MRTIQKPGVCPIADEARLSGGVENDARHRSAEKQCGGFCHGIRSGIQKRENLALAQIAERRGADDDVGSCAEASAKHPMRIVVFTGEAFVQAKQMRHTHAHTAPVIVEMMHAAV